MKKTNQNQDSDILLFLIHNENSTSYAISQDTGISIPQTEFRLTKLIDNGVVKEVKEENRTTYSVHEALKSKDLLKNIEDMIQSMAYSIDNIEPISLDGFKCVLNFISGRIEFVEPEKEIICTDIEPNKAKIIIFKDELQEYALKNNLEITSIKGWTEPKIEWMALNERKCACRPETRICPCPEGLVEARTKKNKMCTCSLFKSLE